mmetsp:Transcript_1520/g.4811  ORF Transcript_1520/g.4811 Transcript_1520/m.4811 type:complete len:230 (+) Transcript_1520:132-821(+)
MAAASSMTSSSAWLSVAASAGEMYRTVCRCDLYTLMRVMRPVASLTPPDDVPSREMAKWSPTVRPSACRPSTTKSKSVCTLSTAGEVTKMLEKPYATAAAIDSPSVADLPRPRPDVSATVARGVRSAAASMKERRARPWSTVRARRSSGPIGSSSTKRATRSARTLPSWARRAARTSGEGRASEAGTRDCDMGSTVSRSSSSSAAGHAASDSKNRSLNRGRTAPLPSVV